MTGRTPLRIGFGTSGFGLSIDELIRLGTDAEGAGFDSFWVGENPREPWVSLAAVAEQTRRITLGTGISSWARSPVVTELAAADLDELSRGRLILGLGTGPLDRCESWHGLPTSRPARRMREYVESLRLLWTAYDGRTVDFSGQLVQVHGYRRAIRPFRNRIPIYLGALGPAMIRMAGECCDGLLLDALTTTAYLHDRVAPSLSTGLALAQRARETFDLGSVVLVAVDDNIEQAYALARPQVADYLVGAQALPLVELHGLQAVVQALMDASGRGSSQALNDALPDEVIDMFAVVGPRARCRDRLSAYVGLDFVVLWPTTTGLEPDQIRANVANVLDAFAEA